MEIDTKKIITLTQEQQIFMRPSMYIGSNELIQSELPTAIVETHTRSQSITETALKLDTQSYSQQSQKMFDEIIQNSIDNYIKSREADPEINYFIYVELGKRQFTVRNNGLVFKVNPKKLNDIDRVFSALNTSDQYNKTDKVVAGANGQGSKLVNMFSKLFEIEVCSNGYVYTSTWTDMKQSHESELVECESEDEERYFQTRVELLDLKTERDIQGFHVEYNFHDLNVDLILKYLFDLKFVFPKIDIRVKLLDHPKIKSNEYTLNGFESIEKYLELYKVPSDQFVSFQFPPIDERIKIKDKRLITVVLFKITSNTVLKRYSLINGIQSMYADNQPYKDLGNAIKKKLQGARLVFGCFMFGLWPVDYSEQVKEKITTKIQFDGSISDEVIRFVQSLTPQKVQKHLFIPKLYEANNINKANAKCTLIITEGDSASGLFTTLYSLFPKFRDNYGLFPLRGKIKNANSIKQDEFSISTDNKEIQNLIQVLGLKTNQEEQDVELLRYRKVLVASDYDVDGFHIKGLFIHLINTCWPELITQQFIQEFRSPIITCQCRGMNGNNYQRGLQKNETLEFFSQQDFDEFRHEHQSQISNVKYFKGLGSFTDVEAKKIGTHFIDYVKDVVPTTDKYDKMITDMYGRDSQKRKNIIINTLANPQQDRTLLNGLTESQIGLEFIILQQVADYSCETLERAIPNFMDGLKDSQRKIVYYCISHNFDSVKQKIKVSQLSGKVSADLDYHHGEGSLQDAIVKLAQSFPGTNNCNLLYPEGIYGTRFEPDTASSARYIFTYTSKWGKLLFNKDDQVIYNYNLSDEGTNIEPHCLYPLVPIQLVNGALGIASGWTCQCPCYALSDVIAFIKDVLAKKNPKRLTPSYNGYTGQISIEVDKEGVETMICDADFTYEDGTLSIHDTTIQTSICQLEGFLKEKQQVYTRNENLVIKRCSDELFEQIYSKFLHSSLRLTKLNFLWSPTRDSSKKIVSFVNTSKFLIAWTRARLEMIEKRQSILLIQLVRDYVAKWCIWQVIDRHYLDDIKDTDKFTNHIRTLIPWSEIQEWTTTLDDAIYTLNHYKFTPHNDVALSEFNYLLDKTVKFYNNFKETQLEDIIAEYTELKSTSPSQLWSNELDKVM